MLSKKSTALVIIFFISNNIYNDIYIHIYIYMIYIYIYMLVLIFPYHDVCICIYIYNIYLFLHIIHIVLLIVIIPPHCFGISRYDAYLCNLNDWIRMGQKQTT